MQQEAASIFNEDFAVDTSMRRRDLMPLGLKIYVWLFLIVSAIIIPVSCAAYRQYLIAVDLGLTNRTISVSDLSGLLFSVLLFLSALFILLEKKWAIFFAIVVVSIVLLSDVYFLITLLIPDTDFISEMIAIFWWVLKIPYFILLFRIKKIGKPKRFPARNYAQIEIIHKDKHLLIPAIAMKLARLQQPLLARYIYQRRHISYLKFLDQIFAMCFYGQWAQIKLLCHVRRCFTFCY